MEQLDGIIEPYEDYNKVEEKETGDDDDDEEDLNEFNACDLYPIC